MMDHQPKPISEHDLVGFVDNALTRERRAEVQAYLNDHPEAAQQVAADQAIVADLRRAFDGLTKQIPTPDLTPAASVRPRYLAMAASLAAALVLGGVLGWGLKPAGTTAPAPTFIADAFAAHRTFVVEAAHPVEVRAENKGHLATWLSNRLERHFVIPDLRMAGLTLIGGRLLPSGDLPAAQLMYEDTTGARITLYLRRGMEGDPSFRFVQGETDQAFYWSDTTFGYALTGNLSRERMLDIAHLLQSQFAPATVPF